MIKTNEQYYKNITYSLNRKTNENKQNFSYEIKDRINKIPETNCKWYGKRHFKIQLNQDEIEFNKIESKKIKILSNIRAEDISIFNPRPDIVQTKISDKEIEIVNLKSGDFYLQVNNKETPYYFLGIPCSIRVKSYLEPKAIKQIVNTGTSSISPAPLKLTFSTDINKITALDFLQRNINEMYGLYNNNQLKEWLKDLSLSYQKSDMTAYINILNKYIDFSRSTPLIKDVFYKNNLINEIFNKEESILLIFKNLNFDFTLYSTLL